MSVRISSASLKLPFKSRTLTPIASKALVYLVSSTPSSRVSPSFTLCNLARIVFNDVPITSALCLVFATRAARIDVA